jgi:putative transposase
MGLPRSTFYATPQDKPSDAELVAEIRAITDVFECYAYRRVGAELRHRGHVVNAKKVRRLMREHDLNPRRRRRFTRTTDVSVWSRCSDGRMRVPIVSTKG